MATSEIKSEKQTALGHVGLRDQCLAANLKKLLLGEGPKVGDIISGEGIDEFLSPLIGQDFAATDA